MIKKRVLFVCIHNSARSQMAEAFLNLFGGGKYQADSAGLEPGVLNPYVVGAMKLAGINIGCNIPKGVETVINNDYDYVVTVCDEASAERCPVFPAGGQRLHWGFADPSSAEGNEQQKLEFAVKVRDQIRDKVREFIKEQKEQ